MRIPAQARGLTLVSVALALVWSVGLGVLHRAGAPAALESIEGPLADLRFQFAGRRPPPDDVVVIAIDDATAEAVGTYPLPRPHLAKLVEELTRRRAAVIAIDLLLLDPLRPDIDQPLAATLRAAPSVLAIAALFASGSATAGDMPLAQRLLMPMPSLRQGIALGTVNIGTDSGGAARQIPLVIATEGGLATSFVLRAAGLAAGRDPRVGADRVTIGERPPTRLDLGYALPLRFFGPRGTIPTVSAAKILRGEEDGEPIAGKIAVIGATAVASGDTFATPFDPVMPGVEILATGIANLTRGDGLARDPTTRFVDGAAGVALALIAALLLSLAPPGLAAALVVAAGFGWFAISGAAFAQGIWLSAAMPLAAMLAPALFTGFARQAMERRRAGRVAASEAALRGFQSQPLAEALAADPAFLAEPVAGEATIVFLDLSGFTGLSERLGPAATRNFLSGFHGEVEKIVVAHRGIVEGFMGDGAMVVFGLPAPRPDDATRAVDCAFALHREITAWMTRAAPAPLRIRVGAQRGPVVFSRLGAETHQQITATGDSVNVAARLLEVASRENAAIVLAAALSDAASPPIRASARHEIAIRGRAQSLEVDLWRESDLTAPRLAR